MPARLSAGGLTAEFAARDHSRTTVYPKGFAANTLNPVTVVDDFSLERSAGCMLSRVTFSSRLLSNGSFANDEAADKLELCNPAPTTQP